MYVAPDRRGEGLATAGMAAVVELALREIAPVVSLYVNEHNVAARRAYERAGFGRPAPSPRSCSSEPGARLPRMTSIDRDVQALAGIFATSGVVHLVRPQTFEPLMPAGCRRTAR